MDELYKVGGRDGRADLLLAVDSERRYAAVAEVKDVDWEAVRGRGTLRRTADRYARQLWTYLDGTATVAGSDGRPTALRLPKLDRYAAMVFPRGPIPTTRTEVEDAFGSHGISVVWLDDRPPEDVDDSNTWHAVLERRDELPTGAFIPAQHRRP